MPIRRYAEHHGELIFLACKLLERNLDVVTGVELHVETQERLGDGRHRTRQVFTGVLRLKDGRIRTEQSDRASRLGWLHQVLGRKETACADYHAKKDCEGA